MIYNIFGYGTLGEVLTVLHILVICLQVLVLLVVPGIIVRSESGRSFKRPMVRGSILAVLLCLLPLFTVVNAFLGRLYLGSYSYLIYSLLIYVWIFFAFALTFSVKRMWRFIALACVPLLIGDLLNEWVDQIKSQLTAEQCMIVSSANSLLSGYHGKSSSCRNSTKAKMASFNYVKNGRPEQCPTHWWDSRDYACISQATSVDEVEKIILACKSGESESPNKTSLSNCFEKTVPLDLKERIDRCENYRGSWHGCGSAFED